MVMSAEEGRKKEASKRQSKATQHTHMYMYCYCVGPVPMAINHIDIACILPVQAIGG